MRGMSKLFMQVNFRSTNDSKEYIISAAHFVRKNMNMVYQQAVISVKICTWIGECKIVDMV